MYGPAKTMESLGLSSTQSVRGPDALSLAPVSHQTALPFTSWVVPVLRKEVFVMTSGYPMISVTPGVVLPNLQSGAPALALHAPLILLTLMT